LKKEKRGQVSILKRAKGVRQKAEYAEGGQEIAELVQSIMRLLGR
jgi:hypothetical protein